MSEEQERCAQAAREREEQRVEDDQALDHHKYEKAGQLDVESGGKP